MCASGYVDLELRIVLEFDLKRLIGRLNRSLMKRPGMGLEFDMAGQGWKICGHSVIGQIFGFLYFISLLTSSLNHT